MFVFEGGLRNIKSNVKTGTGFVLGIKDEAVKSIFYLADEKLIRDFVYSLLEKRDLKKVVSHETFKLEYGPNDIPVKNANERRASVDILFKINERVLLNIEVNTWHKNVILLRNCCYAMRLFTGEMERGNKFDEKNALIQINLTSGKKSDRIYRRYTIKDDSNTEYIQNFVIYEFYVDNLKKCWYDRLEIKDVKKRIINYSTIDRFAGLLALVLDDEEIRKMIESDFISEKSRNILRYIEGRMIEMNIKTNLFTWLSPEKDIEMIQNGLIEEAKDEGERIGLSKGEKIGLSKGEKIGRYDERRQLVKKMLNDGLDPSFIKKYVKMSMSDINKIKTTII